MEALKGAKLTTDVRGLPSRPVQVRPEFFIVIAKPASSLLGLAVAVEGVQLSQPTPSPSRSRCDP